MTLDGYSRVFRHGKARTLYVTIPSRIASDSSFGIKGGDEVRIEWDPKLHCLYIREPIAFTKKVIRR